MRHIAACSSAGPTSACAQAVSRSEILARVSVPSRAVRSREARMLCETASRNSMRSPTIRDPPAGRCRRYSAMSALIQVNA